MLMERLIMPLLPTRLHAYVALVLLACLLIAGIVILLLPRERVTRANFEKILIGMSQADVHRLLGPPDFQAVELGIFRGPDYELNSLFGPDKLRRMGYREYTRLYWRSQQIGINVILDNDGIVVFRYSLDEKGPESWTDLVRYWISWLSGIITLASDQ
jgi:hypothetical protein